MPSVYIETSFPSFYFETRTSPLMQVWHEATRAWWDHHRNHYDLVTSEVVLREVAAAPRAKAEVMSKLIRDLPLLNVDQHVAEIANQYLKHKLVPADAIADALHIAIASYHAIDFLLTWNIKHLANANKRRHLATLNARLGIEVPTITTPELLIPD